MSDPLHLAELLCARICHDLSGPLGSLIGVMELAAEDPASNAEALEVAGEAATMLGKRLELLRAAWSGEMASLELRHIQRLAQGLPSGKRVVLDTAGLDPGASFAPGAAQLVLNALLLAGESLPAAASSHCPALPSRTWSSRSRVRARLGLRDWPAASPTRAAAWAALTSARTVQGPVTALIARRAGLGVSLMMPAGAGGGPAPLLLRLGSGV